MKTLNNAVIAAITVIALTGCDAPVTPAASSASVDSTEVQPKSQNVLSTPQNASVQTFDQVYFVKSRTVNNASNTGYSYTATGYCTVYRSAVYCWDDGLKVISFMSNHVTSVFGYTFFGVGYYGANQGGTDRLTLNGSGSLDKAYLSAPTELSSTTQGNMGINPQTVLTSGQAVHTQCHEDSAQLICDDFQIDLTQQAL